MLQAAVFPFMPQSSWVGNWEEAWEEVREGVGGSGNSYTMLANLYVHTQACKQATQEILTLTWQNKGLFSSPGVGGGGFLGKG